MKIFNILFEQDCPEAVVHGWDQSTIFFPKFFSSFFYRCYFIKVFHIIFNSTKIWPQIIGYINVILPKRTKLTYFTLKNSNICKTAENFTTAKIGPVCQLPKHLKTHMVAFFNVSYSEFLNSLHSEDVKCCQIITSIKKHL